ncbi:hypothetical protein [Gracilibacillus xinjiangensis]|uniref:DUF3955 domain-containing protein n=1 Tax=Gracilibacillus xinjiangensis TaxID=1193282 RepID=A0ABV8WRM4_9BACI
MVLYFYNTLKGVIIIINKGINLIALGLVLIFISQMIKEILRFSGITYMSDGQFLSGPPISTSIYFIPAILIAGGVVILLLSFKGKI